jgi:hypothetical protein
MILTSFRKYLSGLFIYAFYTVAILPAQPFEPSTQATEGDTAPPYIVCDRMLTTGSYINHSGDRPPINLRSEKINSAVIGSRRMGSN